MKIREEYTCPLELTHDITIMQHIGIELMKENGMEDVLKAKGFID
ncbi:hypothetical protein [Clostridium sp. OS1-26]|nr:hypothetical protein [Clostridium sp. OS1-26]WML37900.1 hypothetical protein RCG18_13185 [Clostridium sp. OS1-26]